MFWTFTSNHVQKSLKYTEILIEHYCKSKIWERWKRVKYKCCQLPTGEDVPQGLIEEIKSIEATASELMISAARQVGSRGYTNGKPYSSKLSEAASELISAKRQLKKAKATYNYAHNEDVQDSIEDVRLAYNRFREIQRQAADIRCTFLEELAEKRGLQWKMKQAAALKVIIRAEASRKTFARHGRYMKPLKKGSI